MHRTRKAMTQRALRKLGTIIAKLDRLEQQATDMLVWELFRRTKMELIRLRIQFERLPTGEPDDGNHDQQPIDDQGAEPEGVGLGERHPGQPDAADDRHQDKQP